MKKIIKNNMELIVPDLVFENDYKNDGWVVITQPKNKTEVVKKTEVEKEVKRTKETVKKVVSKVSKESKK